MMGIPAGPFAMGSEEYADEEPVHEVYLDDYLIDRDEISVAQYRGGRSGDLSGTGPGRGLQLGAQTSTPLDLTPKRPFIIPIHPSGTPK